MLENYNLNLTIDEDGFPAEILVANIDVRKKIIFVKHWLKAKEDFFIFENGRADSELKLDELTPKIRTVISNIYREFFGFDLAIAGEE